MPPRRLAKESLKALIQCIEFKVSDVETGSLLTPKVDLEDAYRIPNATASDTTSKCYAEMLF